MVYSCPDFVNTQTSLVCQGYVILLLPESEVVRFGESSNVEILESGQGKLPSTDDAISVLLEQGRD